MMDIPYLDQSQLTYLTLFALRMYAPVEMGERTIWAFLDSGANRLSIHEDLAEGLPRADMATVRGAFAERSLEQVRIDFSFMGQDFQQRQAHVIASPEASPLADGLVLDAPTIFAQPMVFDFHLMAIAHPEAYQGVPWTLIPAVFHEVGICFVQMEAPAGAAWALFDTGAGITVIHAAHAEEMGLTLRPNYRIQVSDATGTKVDQEVVSCQGLAVQGMVLPAFNAFVADLTPIEEALHQRIDMVLGATTMLKSGLHWRFDREAGQVWVAR